MTVESLYAAERVRRNGSVALDCARLAARAFAEQQDVHLSWNVGTRHYRQLMTLVAHTLARPGLTGHSKSCVHAKATAQTRSLRCVRSVSAPLAGA